MDVLRGHGTSRRARRSSRIKNEVSVKRLGLLTATDKLSVVVQAFKTSIHASVLFAEKRAAVGELECTEKPSGTEVTMTLEQSDGCTLV